MYFCSSLNYLCLISLSFSFFYNSGVVLLIIRKSSMLVSSALSSLSSRSLGNILDKFFWRLRNCLALVKETSSFNSEGCAVASFKSMKRLFSSQLLIVEWQLLQKTMQSGSLSPYYCCVFSFKLKLSTSFLYSSALWCDMKLTDS